MLTLMITLTLLLTLRHHNAIIINEDKQQHAMSEVDLKSKVGCFLPKSPQVVLGTSRRLEVDLGSLLYQVGSDWHTKVTPRSRDVESAYNLCRYMYGRPNVRLEPEECFVGRPLFTNIFK